MARTVVSVIQNQQAPKTKREALSRPAKKTPTKPIPLTSPCSSINRLPPKKRGRVAKKLQVQDDATNSQVQSLAPAAKKTTEAKKKTSKNSGEVESSPAQAKKTIEAKKKTSKRVGTAEYLSMITECIVKLRNWRNGSSRAAILNQLKLDHSQAIGDNEEIISRKLSMALEYGIVIGVLVGKDISGSFNQRITKGFFKLTDEEKMRRRKAATKIKKSLISNQSHDQ